MSSLITVPTFKLANKTNHNEYFSVVNDTAVLNDSFKFELVCAYVFLLF